MKEQTVDKLLKFTLGLLLLVVIALVFEGWYFLKLKNKKLADFVLPEKETTEITAPEEKTTPTLVVEDELKLSNLEIAEKVLDWLDKQRDENGVYYVSRMCTEKGYCEEATKAGTSGHNGIAPIWGRFKYYEKTKDPSSMEIINKDLNTYSDSEKVEMIQNDFWNCKFMYELWQSDLLSEKQKSLAEEICWRRRSTYHSPPELESYVKWEIIDNIWTEVAKNEVDLVNLKSVVDGNISFQEKLPEDFAQRLQEYTTYPSEFVARYFWKENEIDLTKAKFYFNKAIQAYFQKTDLFKQSHLCSLGISSLDFQKVEKERVYIEFAEDLFEQAQNVNSQVKHPLCITLAQGLFEETEDRKYQAIKKSLVQELVDQTFDYPGYSGYTSGQVNFREIRPGGAVESKRLIRQNSLISGILSD